MWWFVAWLGCAAPPPVEPAPPPRDLEGVRVHLTIDDAPFHVERGTPVPLDAAGVRTHNDRLLAALGGRDVKASVFFVCDRLQPGDQTIEHWAAMGHTIGNHTDHHSPVADVGAEAFLAEVEHCRDVLHGRTKERQRWFRHPYLGYGDGPDQQRAVREGLEALGLRDAPVTVATTEWMYATAYRRAAGDDARRREIVADWLRHMDEALGAGRALADRVVRREVPQVVLLHDDALVADHVRVLIDRWRARGATFVDLATAMEDPVFALPPKYEGPAGLSWLARIAEPGQRQPYWFGEEEARVVARWGPPPVAGEE